MSVRRGLRPLQRRPIPKPCVAQVIRSIEPAEEHYLLSDRVVGHLGRSAGWRGRVCGDLHPASAVETPCVIEIACAVGSAERDDFPADWIIGHCEIRTRRGRIVWRKLNPILKTNRSSPCTHCTRDRNAATAKNYRCMRKATNLRTFHQP